MTQPLLDIRNLSVGFVRDGMTHLAVQAVSLSVGRGEIVGLVGESGCGKSLTAKAVMGLIGRKPGQVAGGDIRFEGRNLLEATDREIQALRGHRIAMIFQDPMTSLNPVFTIGNQIAEVPRIHEGAPANEAWATAVSALEQVGIAEASTRARQVPFEFSGGMRQRAVIAMGLAGHPDLLLADEPTTALDVTVQAQILDLLKQLRDRTGCGILLITHDLGVVAETCDRVAVMYAGRIVEEASVKELFARPRHPYTDGLFRAVPTLERTGRLEPIPGQPPDLDSIPAQGCPFRDRCPLAESQCADTMPPLVGCNNHRVACWKREVGS
ncbi:MAG TPA: ABC transporter ATP-binding protein [Kiritimatiellia bacterium]|nr:ABC transporter ATP-binding protein [Kiritimatiellia bacterium]